MRAGSLLREALASARGQRVSSIMVALIVAAMCITTLLTVGRTVAAEAQVQDRLEQAGSRHIRIDDVAGKGFLSPAVLRVLGGFDSVERVIGADAPVEVVNSRIGDAGGSVPGWMVQGDQDNVAELVAGRWPEPGEAVVSTTALDTLGMDAPVGGLTLQSNNQRASVVGSFRARGGFEKFQAGALVAAATTAPVDSVEIIASSASAARLAQAAALALLARADPSDLQVDSPTTLAEVQQDVLGDLQSSNRLLVLLVLGAGAVLSAIVVLAGVLLHRKDLGRRRALGAPRSALTLLVIVRTGVVAVPAVVVGTAVGLTILLIDRQRPDAAFVLAVAVLAALTAVAASVVPAVIAAWQDPLRVLRTP